MSTLATLSPTRLSVEPGAAGSVSVEVRNTGQVVEGYRIAIVGDPGGWASVEPAVIDGLLPGTAKTVTVTFSPPRSSEVLAGDHDFGVEVVAVLTPAEAEIPEGVVEVLPFRSIGGELSPKMSRARRSAVHNLAIDNRGNVPVTLVLDGADPNDQLDVEPRPDEVTVGPGQAAFSAVHVRALHTFWRGPDRSHPFTVSASSEQGDRLDLDGTFVQRSVLPPWFLKALLALLALLLLLLLLWFLVFKPVIESAAKAAVEDPVAEAEQAAEAAQSSAAGAQTAAQQAGAAAQAADESLQETSEVVEGFTEPPEIVVPASIRLRTLSKPGGPSASDPYDVPGNATFRLTDLVVSNPQGDFGRARILVAGDVVFDLALENFRDLDFHFQSPIVVGGGEAVTLSVSCRAAGVPPAQSPPPTSCDTSLFLGGTVSTPRPTP